MRDAADYLAQIKALIIAHPRVAHWSVVREEAQVDVGLFRYRLSLNDGGFLEMFERFQVVAGKPQVTTYSFHWQDAGGRLVKRWDNAAHHPEIFTYPHHIHDGAEDKVLPHEAVNAAEILRAIAAPAVSE